MTVETTVEKHAVAAFDPAACSASDARGNATVPAAESKKQRNTRQRALVLEAVRQLHNHPTSADVYEQVRLQHPGISRATVYRNLGVLAQRGEVLRVEIPNGADRYDFRNQPHYHAKCRVCGRVFDVEVPYCSEMDEQAGSPQGFAVESHQIVFTGVCASCQEKAGK